MKKKLISRFVLGGLISLCVSHMITLFISLCIGNGAYHAVSPALTERCGTELNAVLFQSIGSLLYGGTLSGCSVIWELDGWSTLKKTVVHLLITSLVTFPIAFILNWMPHTLSGAALYFLCFILFYAAFWIAQCIVTRRKLRQLNARLHN